MITVDRGVICNSNGLQKILMKRILLTFKRINAHIVFSRIVEEVRMADRSVLKPANNRIVQLRLSLALLRLRLAVKAGFDPNQLRDEQGRWTGGDAGQTTVTGQYRMGNNRIDSKTDTLTDIAKEVIGEVGQGSGSTYGILIHKRFAEKLEASIFPESASLVLRRVIVSRRQ